MLLWPNILNWTFSLDCKFPLVTVFELFTGFYSKNLECTACGLQFMFRPNPLKQCCVKIDQLNFCKQFLIYRKVTTPSLSYAHAQCRNPKKVSKKVATLEKTTFLYRSKSLISLWLGGSDDDASQRRQQKKNKNPDNKINYVREQYMYIQKYVWINCFYFEFTSYSIYVLSLFKWK